MSKQPISQTVVSKCPTCGGDAVDRSEFWEAVPENGAELEQQISSITKAIENYYLALDRRQNGDTAGNIAFDRIEKILGMRWKQGEMTERLERYPALKKLYD